MDLQTMEFTFSEENLQKIEREFTKYPKKQSVVMKALYLAQEQHGYITNEVIQTIAKLCEMPEEDVLGVVTFYTMYHQKPVGKYHLQVCTNVSCMLRGGYKIWDAIRERYGLENHGLTEDGRFSLEEVECMGSCGTAPMIAVNDEFYENLTEEKALQLLESLK